MEHNNQETDTESITINDNIVYQVEPVEVKEDKNMVKAKKRFHDILHNYKSIQTNIDNMQDDIEKLEKIHQKFVLNSENKLSFHEFSSYVDDIFYQINLLRTEHCCQTKIQLQNVNKFYKDLYRLFNRIVKKIISRKTEYKSAEKIIAERKNYFIKIKPFNEISENYIHIDECSILFTEIELRISEFCNTIQEISQSILNTEEQRHEGVLLSTFLISLKTEKEKAQIEHDHFKKLLIGILNSHLKISSKYLERTTQISQEVTNDESPVAKLLSK
jgi:hypothetical protein